MRACRLSLDSCKSARELCVVLTTGRASAQPPLCLLPRDSAPSPWDLHCSRKLSFLTLLLLLFGCSVVSDSV